MDKDKENQPNFENYTKIPQSIAERTDINQNEKSLISLINHLEKQKGCKMSSAQLGKYIGLSTRAVFTAIKKLKEKQLIKVKHAENNKNDRTIEMIKIIWLKGEEKIYNTKYEENDIPKKLGYEENDIHSMKKMTYMYEENDIQIIRNNSINNNKENNKEKYWNLNKAETNKIERYAKRLGVKAKGTIELIESIRGNINDEELNKLNAKKNHTEIAKEISQLKLSDEYKQLDKNGKFHMKNPKRTLIRRLIKN